jgi:hypothetical protein
MAKQYDHRWIYQAERLTPWSAPVGTIHLGPDDAAALRESFEPTARPTTPAPLLRDSTEQRRLTR